MRFQVAIAAAALLVAIPSASRAQTPEDALARGIDPLGNKLATGLDGFLTVEGAKIAPVGSWKLELALDYAEGLLALKLGDEKLGDLVERRLDLHLLGAYAVTDWSEVGVDLPFTLYQPDALALLQDELGFAPDPPASSAGLGDPRLVYKLRVLREDVHFVTVGGVAELRLPLGDDQSFMGERGFLVAPRATVERTFYDKLRVALEGGYRFRTEPGQFINLYVGDELVVAGAASHPLPDIPQLQWWKGYAEVIAATPSRAPFTIEAAEALKTPLEALVGVRAGVGGCWQAMVGGGTGIAAEAGFGRESFRLFASARCERIISDKDGDGIPDEEDKCPDVPEDKDGVEDADGCPEDDLDKDGVPDAEDKCPTVAGPKEFQGCPDEDGDEIPDHEDKCPKEKGPAQNDGCPVKEEEPTVVLEEERLTLKDSINFDTGKASIKSESNRVLDEAAKILIAHPEVERLRIEGHTDSQGSARFNLELSQKRAQAVVDYLVKKGVAKKRLFARGYGEEKPIATNDTALGRAKNRRVEFFIVQPGESEQGAAPTGGEATDGPATPPTTTTPPTPDVPATPAGAPPKGFEKFAGPQPSLAFPGSGADIVKSQRPTLDRLAAALKKSKQVKVTIAASAADPKLATARAEVLKKYLVLSGVPASRVEAAGAGGDASVELRFSE